MLQGQLADLHRSDGVIVDIVDATGKLAMVLLGGKREPMKIGDTMELNDHRAVCRRDLPGTTNISVAAGRLHNLLGGNYLLAA